MICNELSTWGTYCHAVRTADKSSECMRNVFPKEDILSQNCLKNWKRDWKDRKCDIWKHKQLKPGTNGAKKMEVALSVIEDNHKSIRQLAKELPFSANSISLTHSMNFSVLTIFNYCKRQDYEKELCQWAQNMMSLDSLTAFYRGNISNI